MSDEPKRKVRARLTVADTVLDIVCDRPLRRADWLALYRIADVQAKHAGVVLDVAGVTLGFDSAQERDEIVRVLVAQNAPKKEEEPEPTTGEKGGSGG